MNTSTINKKSSIMMKIKQILMIVAATTIVSISTQADPIVSNDFQQARGVTENSVNRWTTLETSSYNIGVVGDFTLTLSMTSNGYSNYGPTFSNAVLGNRVVGEDNYVASSQNMLVTLTATYTGAEPFVDSIKLVIDSINIYAVIAASGDDGTQIRWKETTSGHESASSYVTLKQENTGLAASYTLVSWNPGDFVVSGTNTIRTFTLETDGSRRLVDGFSVLGHVEAIPEPATATLLLGGAFILAAILRRRRM